MTADVRADNIYNAGSLAMHGCRSFMDRALGIMQVSVISRKGWQWIWACMACPLHRKLPVRPLVINKYFRQYIGVTLPVSIVLWCCTICWAGQDDFAPHPCLKSASERIVGGPQHGLTLGYGNQF